MMTITGNLEHVRIARQFLDVSGWLAHVDGSALAGHMSLGFEAGPMVQLQLQHRDDLEQAGIAGGLAGFRAAIPYSGPISATEIRLFASNEQGESFPMVAAKPKISRFIPSGAIDTLTSQHISGWVHNPSIAFGHKAELFMNGEWPFELSPTVQRPDLQRWYGLDALGFTSPVAEIVERAASLQERHPLATTIISLASSEIILAEVELQVTRNGDIVSRPRLDRVGATVLRSDYLDKFTQQFKKDPL